MIAEFGAIKISYFKVFDGHNNKMHHKTAGPSSLGSR